MALTHLLDTNACVEMLRNPGSPAAIRASARPLGDVVICSIVVAELSYGAERSRDPVTVRGQVRALCATFPSLPFDDRAAEFYGAIRADLAAPGLPIGGNDLMIAAIALAHGLTLVTHNIAEFGRVAGLTVEDWQSL